MRRARRTRAGEQEKRRPISGIGQTGEGEGKCRYLKRTLGVRDGLTRAGTSGEKANCTWQGKFSELLLVKRE